MAVLLVYNSLPARLPATAAAWLIGQKYQRKIKLCANLFFAEAELLSCYFAKRTTQYKLRVFDPCVFNHLFAHFLQHTKISALLRIRQTEEFGVAICQKLWSTLFYRICVAGCPAGPGNSDCFSDNTIDIPLPHYWASKLVNNPNWGKSDCSLHRDKPAFLLNCSWEIYFVFCIELLSSALHLYGAHLIIRSCFDGSCVDASPPCLSLCDLREPGISPADPTTPASPATCTQTLWSSNQLESGSFLPWVGWGSSEDNGVALLASCLSGCFLLMIKQNN